MFWGSVGYVGGEFRAKCWPIVGFRKLPTLARAGGIQDIMFAYCATIWCIMFYYNLSDMGNKPFLDNNHMMQYYCIRILEYGVNSTTALHHNVRYIFYHASVALNFKS